MSQFFLSLRDGPWEVDGVSPPLPGPDGVIVHVMACCVSAGAAVMDTMTY